jgi:hypothetical protein
MTIPPLEDNSIHRYDLLKRRMQDPTTMDTTLAAIARTLQAGGRSWLVGRLPAVPEGAAAPPPPRAPAPGLEWDVGAYSDRWARQVFAVVRDHVTKAEEVPVPVPGRVNPYENRALFLMEGWR